MGLLVSCGRALWRIDEKLVVRVYIWEDKRGKDEEEISWSKGRTCVTEQSGAMKCVDFLWGWPATLRSLY